ncbi:hypothetical protein JCM10908_001171 [Rhodotorula pacifica]|uniref:hemerythrin domain-containing protein n=1 Tax=Rhodotorula pacifica TaxID=1495444 RepID=UPI003175FB54
MSSYNLKDAITPSRKSVPPRKQSKGARKGDIELPDYIAPEPKTAAERRDWDRMSSRMEGFHTYFRQSFKQLFELADGSFAKHGLSVKDFMGVAESFHEHLGFHHGIEEQHIFPVLAKRMPQFRDDHQEEHDAIHKGMDELLALISKYRSDPTSYSPDDFRRNLASWGPLLFYHLDAEVETLKPDILRRYWTIEEVRRLPM